MAVHLAIASVDAVTAEKLGTVSSGQDHTGSVELLAQISLDGVASVVRQMRSILESKTRIEYGAEVLTPARASELARQSIRVFEWAEDLL